ncbi:gamma carbonic anhydrase family protein [Deinococcus deserti]|uniref:Gamma carbonic anhydrase family protein n=1 Tax=Deinococcus deserti (strain DSM 17065 / CIP 109153 / LMG 22923 / VCD115) TaxID=546414 RepID=C1CUK8_DEIDV|nr:gamma carbonic anhydrase family protein [Deinococcus deserti]ACO45875.1 hypothetical protein Deide_09940 [Deinococcus deserti VCD115]
MPRYALEGHVPEIHATAFIAPSADVIGQVTVAEGASVWFGVVLRGDLEAIEIGPGCNVQDGAVLHTDAGWPCVLTERVTVGHRAIVHGASCGPGSLVGMGAVMLSGSSLGAGAMLGAGAVLPEGVHVPDGMLAVGVPARVVRPAPSTGNAARYVRNAARFNDHLRRLPEPGIAEYHGEQKNDTIENGRVEQTLELAGVEHR